VPTNDSADRFEVVDRTDFVIDGHHADDRDGTISCDDFIERCAKLIKIDTASVINADDNSAMVLDHFEDRVMLGGWAHCDATCASDGARNRHVVALGSAPGEDNVVRTATEDRSDTVT
jgi:hypothetical protein